MRNLTSEPTLKTHARPRMLRRIAPALGLFVLSPLVAEWLLGNKSIDQFAFLPFLAPLYGGGALLIREVTRRTGRGWPTIVLLALAYGLLEEGLVTQMLFNPDYIPGLDVRGYAYIPPLNISALLTVTALALHTVWSISVPIALVEALVPDRARTPWLGLPGLTVTGIVFLLGVVGGFSLEWERLRFVAPTPQLIGTALVVVVLVAAAFTLWRRPRPRVHARPPSPRLVGALALASSSLFFLIQYFVGVWVSTGVDLVLAAAVTAVIWRWSRTAGWSAAHRLALAAGATLTYVWHGFLQQPLAGSMGITKLLGNLVFAIGACVLLVVAARRVRTTREALSPDARAS